MINDRHYIVRSLDLFVVYSCPFMNEREITKSHYNGTEHIGYKHMDESQMFPLHSNKLLVYIPKTRINGPNMTNVGNIVEHKL